MLYLITYTNFIVGELFNVHKYRPKNGNGARVFYTDISLCFLSYHVFCLMLPSKRKVRTAFSLTVQYNFRFIILSLDRLPDADTELPLQASNTLNRQIILIIFPRVLVKSVQFNSVCSAFAL